jgi:hypothetical protein
MARAGGGRGVIGGRHRPRGQLTLRLALARRDVQHAAALQQRRGLHDARPRVLQRGAHRAGVAAARGVEQRTAGL